MARLWLLISDLPVAALRIDELMSVALQRLGLRSTGNLAQATRAPLNRRFRAVLLRRLDQALGDQPEEISPHSDRPHYTVHMPLATGRATGPEHIAYKWWLDDDNWRSGLRDYWRVKTTQGRQLWLFYTPQNPGWFLQGEFA